MNFRAMKPHMSFACTLGAVILLALTPMFGAQMPTMGPQGGDVRTFAYDPQNPDHILLSTSSGQMFSSNDGGKSWSRFARIGENDSYVLDHIYFHPTDSRIIYVAAWSVNSENGELFRTEDGGASWSSLQGMRGKSIRALTIAPSNPNTIVAGALDGVYRSTNGGKKWEHISPDSLRNVESVAVDPKNENMIYAGTWRLAYKTSDGGANWQKLDRGMDEDSDIFSIAIDAKNPSKIYVGACTGAYKTINAGQTFQRIEAIPVGSRRVRVIKQDPSNPKIIYAGSTTGLWKSVDGGLKWRRVSSPNLIVNDVMVNPRNSKRVLLATDRSGVMASNDGALTFYPSNNGFAHREIRALIVDKSQPGTLYAGVMNDKEFGGAFISGDGGAHWSQISRGLMGSDVFALAQDANNRLVAGTNKGLFRMDPTTQKWVNISLTGMRPYVTDLHIEGDNWFAGSTNGLLHSRDGGQTWHIQRSAGSEPFTLIRASGNRIAAAGYRSLLTSHDGGKNWGWMQSPSVSLITGMALDQNQLLWISSPQGLFHEKANGGWEAVKTDLPEGNIRGLSYDAGMRRMYAVVDSSNEVYASTDGHNWSSLYEGGYAVNKLLPAGDALLVITKYEGIVSFGSNQSAKLAK